MNNALKKKRDLWERGTRAQRDQRVNDAISQIGKAMKKFESSALTQSFHPLEGKEKVGWKFSP